ncbi:dTMP kinase [Sulfolobus sp. E5-1-F]|uniref:dTMP kinase n=1 Tax=Saccharolobus sp. E5-1-F TaxID=2663019 RepID=UPI001294E7F3|nr:dTMP kinase [Sulfolobus sp. E5-1-F]QGA54448.1 dTMP kinase [Sulfolobus sp. E5-1-F]
MRKLVAIEGIDGSGKTTLANLLKEYLESKMKLNVIVTREPFSEDIIKLIEKIGWNDPILLVLLFAADRALHINWLSKIQDDTNLIILDRYYFSSIAYQGALGVDEQWIKMVNSYFPKPDMVILLDLPIEVAISRIKNDKFNFEEKIRSLAKVREKYLKLAKEYNFYIIDASKDKNEVLEQAIKIIQKNLL